MFVCDAIPSQILRLLAQGILSAAGHGLRRLSSTAFLWEDEPLVIFGLTVAQETHPAFPSPSLQLCWTLR